MLPIVPLYLTYFAVEDKEKKKVLPRAIMFVLGFTLVFCLMGLLAGTLGTFLNEYRVIVNIVCGIIVILFGISYLGVFQLKFLKGINTKILPTSLLNAFLFGVIYSISLTPCVGAFLGSALMLATTSGSMFQGVILLLLYSLGLGIPFIISAVLIHKLKWAFEAIKKNYKVINTICGVFLIVVGILMCFGVFNYLASILS